MAATQQHMAHSHTLYSGPPAEWQDWWSWLGHWCIYIGKDILTMKTSGDTTPL